MKIAENKVNEYNDILEQEKTLVKNTEVENQKLSKKIHELETKNAVLSHRLVDQEDKFASLRTEHENLMNAKTALDLEIATLRTMLEAAESRCNKSSDAEPLSKKHKFTLEDHVFNVSSTADGPIEIIDVCKEKLMKMKLSLRFMETKNSNQEQQ